MAKYPNPTMAFDSSPHATMITREAHPILREVCSFPVDLGPVQAPPIRSQARAAANSARRVAEYLAAFPDHIRGRM